jgi:hypothetical protein
MNKKNLITLAVVLVVGYLLWNMSKKQQGQQQPLTQAQCTTAGGTWTDGACVIQRRRFR